MNVAGTVLVVKDKKYRVQIVPVGAGGQGPVKAITLKAPRVTARLSGRVEVVTIAPGASSSIGITRCRARRRTWWTERRHRVLHRHSGGAKIWGPKGSSSPGFTPAGDAGEKKSLATCQGSCQGRQSCRIFALIAR